ncbi:MAG: SPOR domain-containing protein [Gammaproteobacteria bacterium]|nr:SPOR domain-containing protein [Gammaproteobacteria bacterium]
MDTVVSVDAASRLRQWIAGAILIGLISTAFAGPGFIESSRVSVDSTADASSATIEVRFNCKAEYLRHEPQGSSDRLRVYLDPTGICNGVSPVVAESRSRLRPLNSDSANLVDLEYDGDSPAGPMLTFNFSRPVTFDVDMSGASFSLDVHVKPIIDKILNQPDSTSTSVSHRKVSRAKLENPNYVINLASFRRVPTIADAKGLELTVNQRLFYSEVVVDGKDWYRLRLGGFESGEEAAAALDDLKAKFPGAWIDEMDTDAELTEITRAPEELAEEPIDIPEGDGSAVSKVDTLMQDARKSMAAGEISRAIQIYTKVLQQPEHSRMAEAQEYLALAREKNGQMAHAKAEYQRYLSLYPDSEGAVRVNQRLAALLATGSRSDQGTTTASATGDRSLRQSDWRIQTYFSQYYRRDVNQPSDQNETVSQSALYSDVNLDARRRGERFDFSSRLSAGYRNDFLDERTGSGDSLRVSYAYADMADAVTGLRGRIGRQSRNSGGVLGRFDGLNLGYQLGERVLLNTVIGKPAYSSSDGIDSSRSFYGASVTYGPILENLDFGAFYIAQDVEGVQDRQAVGAEFRYFGTNQSLWGMVDYDLAYGELASAYLQGSWRFESRLSIHGLVDRRGSPFLSASNALIGQPVATFEELVQIYSEDELRQLGRDRTSLSTTYTLGLSYPISPKLQVNADASQSTMDGTPASGGVLATEESTYRYYSGSLVASSILKEGDVSIISARYSDSDMSRVISLTLDSRYPIGRTWRINPRLRVDRRQRLADPNYEWLYTPGIRIQYRRSQKFRIELEAGKQFSQRNSDIVDLNLDRQSYFINVGYQSFF